MEKLPIKFKNKLIQLQKNAMKQSQLMLDIADILDKYGLTNDIFTANADIEQQTEALTFMLYGEGNIEDNLKEIEKIFYII